MFWHDIKELKIWVKDLDKRFIELVCTVRQNSCENRLDELASSIECINQTIDEFFFSEDEGNSFNRIHDKLNTLVADQNRQRQVLLAEQTLDKFDVYMKNVDKLNMLINEFKGCVSIARAAIGERKEIDDLKKILKNIMETCDKYYICQKTINDKLSKLDAIYKAICEKPKKKHKPCKKAVPNSS